MHCASLEVFAGFDMVKLVLPASFMDRTQTFQVAWELNLNGRGGFDN